MMMTRNEVLQEMEIAKQANWSERFNELAQYHVDAFGYGYLQDAPAATIIKEAAHQTQAELFAYLMDKEANEVVTYGQHAKAYIYDNHIKFKAWEGGPKYYLTDLTGFWQDRELISFYRSEYLATGIHAKVANYLTK